MKPIYRRTFSRLGGALGAATLVETTVPVRAEAAVSEAEKKKILNYHPGMPYRRLGDKDVFLSVIAMGGLVMNDHGESHHYAIDHGCNVVHISTGYLGEQRDALTARETYRKLHPNQRWNTVCGDCRLCEAACPNDIKIVQRLQNARFAFA